MASKVEMKTQLSLFFDRQKSAKIKTAIWGKKSKCGFEVSKKNLRRKKLNYFYPDFRRTIKDIKIAIFWTKSNDLISV